MEDLSNEEQSIRFPAMSPSKAIHPETPCTGAFFNASLAVSFSLLQTTTVRLTAGKIPFRLRHPEFDTSMSTKRIETLELRGNMTRAIADRKLNIFDSVFMLLSCDAVGLEAVDILRN